MTGESCKEASPQGLASALVADGVLSSDWLPSFNAVPRELFVPDRIWPGIADGTRQNPVVYRSGPRSLWDEVEAAWRWWEDQGRPGFGRFGLTATPDAHTVWLDSPENPVPERVARGDQG